MKKFGQRIAIFMLAAAIGAGTTGCISLDSIREKLEEESVTRYPILSLEAETEEDEPETTKEETTQEPAKEETAAEEETPFIHEVVTENATSVSVYHDERIPAYDGTTTDPESVQFMWESKDGTYNFTITVSVDRNVYRYYTTLGRYLGTQNYIYYLGDSYNEQVVAGIVSAFRQIQEQTKFSDDDMVREIIHFVQANFTYELDSDAYGVPDYPKYPIETIYERTGDCEDTSILAASIIKDMGYGVALLLMDNHCAVGVKGDETVSGTYYLKDGIRYYYVETTNTGYEIGMIPDNIDTSEAYVYVLN